MDRKLNQAIAEALEPRGQAYVRYDRAPPGFGCRVTPAAARSWTFEYRPLSGGRRSATRRMTIGRIDALPYSKARRIAEDLYHRTRLGEDPVGARDDQRGAATVAEVAARFMREKIEPTRKPTTVRYYANLFRLHILPKLGHKAARDVGFSDVAKLHRGIGAHTKITANRAVELVSSMYGWAGKAGEVPRGMNPARDVEGFTERHRTRYLSSEEIARLGATLALAETEGLPYEVDDKHPNSKHCAKPENRRTRISPHAIGAIRLLLLTGCRLGEVLNLKWDVVDFERGLLNLEDSKTGARPIWVNAAALAVLDQLSRIRLGDFVIAGEQVDAPRRDLQRPWRQVIRHADLKGVTLHTLRHTHASIGVGAGIGLPLVGALLGHKVAATTSRYAHIAHEPARRASETIGATISAALEQRPGASITPIKRGA
jgi:integrase